MQNVANNSGEVNVHMSQREGKQVIRRQRVLGGRSMGGCRERERR